MNHSYDASFFKKIFYANPCKQSLKSKNYPIVTNDVSGIKFNEGNIMIRRLLLLLYRISGFFPKKRGNPNIWCI